MFSGLYLGRNSPEKILPLNLGLRKISAEYSRNLRIDSSTVISMRPSMIAMSLSTVSARRPFVASELQLAKYPPLLDPNMKSKRSQGFVGNSFRAIAHVRATMNGSLAVTYVYRVSVG
jgi:hypothetical protein